MLIFALYWTMTGAMHFWGRDTGSVTMIIYKGVLKCHCELELHRQKLAPSPVIPIGKI